MHLYIKTLSLLFFMVLTACADTSDGPSLSDVPLVVKDESHTQNNVKQELEKAKQEALQQRKEMQNK